MRSNPPKIAKKWTIGELFWWGKDFSNEMVEEKRGNSENEILRHPLKGWIPTFELTQIMDESTQMRID